MFINNLADKELLNESLCCNLTDAQVESCTLDEMNFSDKDWSTVSINNSNANNTVFNHFNFDNVTFFRSNLMNICFNQSKINGTTFSGDTLIKAGWNNCRIESLSLANCTLQKMSMNNSIIINSNLNNFEGIYCNIKNTIFKNCSFKLDYNCGMNGFSGGNMENCIFINCSFTGYPLRGIKTDYCTFKDCYGEITDEAECTNTFGMGRFSGEIENIPLINKQNALNFINEWK